MMMYSCNISKCVRIFFHIAFSYSTIDNRLASNITGPPRLPYKQMFRVTKVVTR